MAADEDKISEILLRFFKRAAGPVDRAGCPDEETLAVFIEGNLAGSEPDKVESHLARCALCLDELAAALNAVETTGGEVDVPRPLVNRARALVEGRENRYEIAVRLLRESLQLLSTTGRLVPQPVPAVRSESGSANENRLHVEQGVGRFRVGLVLELAEPGACRVLANVSEETGKPADGVRLTLTSGDRERASFVTRAGSVVFDRLAPGDYSIVVSESGHSLGRVRLNLMLER
jgi:hypothetical protein